MEVFIESMKESELEALTQRLHDHATATHSTESDTPKETWIDDWIDDCIKAAHLEFDQQLYEQLTANKDKPFLEKKRVLLRLIKGGKSD